MQTMSSAAQWSEGTSVKGWVPAGQSWPKTSRHSRAKKTAISARDRLSSAANWPWALPLVSPSDLAHRM